MKTANEDKVKGAFHQAKGKAKALIGEATDNPKLEAKGVAEQLAGKAQTKLGEIKKVVGKP
jgi:uncharacterized protein YjbJ (UPF0337 family)